MKKDLDKKQICVKLSLLFYSFVIEHNTLFTHQTTTSSEESPRNT